MSACDMILLICRRVTFGGVALIEFPHTPEATFNGAVQGWCWESIGY